MSLLFVTSLFDPLFDSEAGHCFRGVEQQLGPRGRKNPPIEFTVSVSSQRQLSRTELSESRSVLR